MQIFKFIVFLALTFFILAEGKDYTINYHAWDTAATTISAAGQNAISPQIALNDSGQAVAVWNRSNGTNTIIQASSSSNYGDSWSTPVNLSVAGQNAIVPQIALNDSGQAVAVWKRSNGTNTIIQASYSINYGDSWSTPVNLSVAGQNAIVPQIAINTSGQAMAVWMRDNDVGGIIQASYSSDGGVTWETPANLSAANEYTDIPQVAINASGKAVAVWQNDSTDVIQAAYSTDGGAWSSPADLSSNLVTSIHPQMALNDSNQAVIVWNERDNLVIQTTYSTNGGQSWSATANLSISAKLENPQIAMNFAGQTIVIWENSQVVKAVYSTDGGITWLDGSQAIVLSATGQLAQNYQIAISDSNRAVAVWRRSNGDNTIIQTNYSTNGGRSWLTPASAYNLSTTGQNATDPQIGLSTSGLATVVWPRMDDESNLRVQINNDYNTAIVQAERQKVRFPMTIDLIDKISWNAMSKVTSYQLYSEPGLTNLIDTYSSGNFYFLHQRTKAKSYYFTVTATAATGGETSTALDIELP